MLPQQFLHPRDQGMEFIGGQRFIAPRHERTVQLSAKPELIALRFAAIVEFFQVTAIEPAAMLGTGVAGLAALVRSSSRVDAERPTASQRHVKTPRPESAG